MQEPVDVFLWRYYCDTEAVWIEEYAPRVPTACANNAGHALSSTKAPQRVVRPSDVVHIDQNNASPNIVGHARLETLRFRDDATGEYYIPGNTTASMTWVSPKYPVALYGMETTATKLMAPDRINLWIDRHKMVGVLASPVSTGANVFSVYNPYVPTVVSMLYTGYEIALRPSALAETTTVTTTGAFAGLTQGQYFNVWAANDSVAYYVWMDTIGDGTTGDPAPAEKTGIAVNVSAAVSDADMAAAIATAVSGVGGNLGASASGTVVTITNAATGPATHAVNVNVTSLIVTTIVPGRAAGAIEELGELIDVKPGTSQIMSDTVTAAGYAAFSTDVLISNRVVKNIYMGIVDGNHRYGAYNLKSSILPPNSVVTVQYENNHPQEATFLVYLEMGQGSQNMGYIV